MKLIIDIPEVTYREVIEGKDTSNTNIYTAIENGTPLANILEDINAEIKFLKDAPGGSYDFNAGLERALLIINKRIGGGEE